MTGGGYGDLDVDGAHAALDGNPDVKRWTVLGFINILTLDGEAMTTVIGLDKIAPTDLTVLRGSCPTRTRWHSEQRRPTRGASTSATPSSSAAISTHGRPPSAGS